MFPLQAQKLVANLYCSYRPMDVLDHSKLSTSSVELGWLTHIRFPVTRTLVGHTLPSPPESVWM